MLAVVAEGFLDAPGIRGSDALIDREGQPKVGRGLAGVAVREAGLA